MKNLTLCLVFLATILQASSAPEVEIETHSGDYQIARLALKSEGKDEGPAWMQLGIRSGKGTCAWLPIGAHEVDASGIRLAEGKITGQVMDRATAFPPGVQFVYTLDAKVEGNRISGTWKRSLNEAGFQIHEKWAKPLEPASGTLEGTLHSEEEIQKEQAFAEGAEWAEWLGPDGNKTGPKTDVAIVDDLSKANPVWKSETITAAAPGRANDIPRHGVKSLYNRPSGGGATPIVADNRVFLNFYLPSGEAYDHDAANKYREQLKKPENIPFFKGKLPTLYPLKVQADDVVVAVDARTGGLLWRTTFPGGGANHTSHKNDINNCSIAHADGRVYAIGSTMRLRCLDAKTGTLLWEKPLGPVTAALETQREEGMKTGKWIKKRNRDWGSSPIVRNGMVISTDMTRGVVAFDAKTGEERWRTEKVSWKNSTPHTWKHGEETFIIVAGLYELSCLDAKDGSVKWKIPAMSYRSAMLAGDLLIYQDKKGPPFVENRDAISEKDPKSLTCVAMRLNPEKPEVLWHMPWNQLVDGEFVKDQYSGYCRPQIVGNHLFLSGRLWTDCFDVTTGKKIARLKAEGGVANAGHLLYAHNRLFSVCDGKHGTTKIALYTADPKDFRTAGPDQVWIPPHPNTTSYGPCMLHPVVDGRIFIRGHDAIYCYDLRAKQ